MASSRENSSQVSSFINTRACNGVVVIRRFITQASRDGASNNSICGGGEACFQNVYIPRRYSLSPVSRLKTPVFVSGRMVFSRHNPGGWYGLTLGPPMVSTSKPEAARALSRMTSAGNR